MLWKRSDQHVSDRHKRFCTGKQTSLRLFDILIFMRNLPAHLPAIIISLRLHSVLPRTTDGEEQRPPWLFILRCLQDCFTVKVETVPSVDLFGKTGGKGEEDKRRILKLKWITWNDGY